MNSSLLTLLKLCIQEGEEMGGVGGLVSLSIVSHLLTLPSLHQTLLLFERRPGRTLERLVELWQYIT